MSRAHPRQVLAVAVLALLGCADPPLRSPPVPTPAAAAAATAYAPVGLTRLHFGLTPVHSHETMVASHRPLASYLARTLAVPVDLSVGGSYDDTIDRMAQGDFDMVELSPFAYVEASRRLKGLKCMVQTISDGSATAAGYIFVRDDSPRHALADLKGARFAFVDKRSTSGYLYPLKLLRERGLEPERDFASVELLGNHEAVLMAVLEGRVDAGATYQGSFGQLWRGRDVDPRSFRVIAKTPRTPRDIYCAAPGLSDEAVQAITAALLGLTSKDRASREILAPLNVNGFQRSDDAAYAEVRKVANEVEGK